MATIEEAFDVVCKTFQISTLNAPQRNGITKIVEERWDVFINLPTGFGKSLLYQALPLVFDLTLKQVVEIKESPNKLNVAYVIQYMDKDTELECYFSWLTDELKLSWEKTDRTIIYCQTIRQCGLVYATIKGLLGRNMFIGDGSKNFLLKCCICALLKKIRRPFWSRFNLKMVLSIC